MKNNFLPFYIIDNSYAYANDDLNDSKSKLFTNSFYLQQHPMPNPDQGIFYELNSFNYRSPEFFDNPDIIFAGCSNTYGIGLPLNGMWSTIVAEKSKMSYVNVAMPGASAFMIVSEIMHYIKMYGKPKYIMCMFPDLARITVYVHRKLNKSFEDFEHYGLTHSYLKSYGDLQERPKYIKRPFAYEDVLPVEMSYFYSLKAIQFLEQYCIDTDIKLLYSSFDEADADMITLLRGNYYSQSISRDQGFWDRTDEGNGIDMFYDIIDNKMQPLMCHEDLRAKFPDTFDIAADRDHGNRGAHFGVHRNIHVADAFIKELGW